MAAVPLEAELPVVALLPVLVDLLVEAEVAVEEVPVEVVSEVTLTRNGRKFTVSGDTTIRSGTSYYSGDGSLWVKLVSSGGGGRGGRGGAGGPNSIQVSR